MEGKKRKLPSRGSRAEPASKKRAASASTSSNTPEQRQTPTPVVAAPTPIVEEKESLPKSITPGQPLPTLDEPQPENLSSKDFQSVSESGVLVDSLQRSRQKWITEGIFEKYWTKTLKKKGWEEPPNNPPRDTMTKLGPCTIVVEPHAFEAIMYAVKDPNARSAFIQDTPMARPPVIQYGPPNGMMPPPAPTPPPQQSQFQTPQTSVKHSPSGANTFKTSMSPAPTPNSIQPSPHATVQSRPPQNGQPTPRQPQNPPNTEAGPDMTEAKKDPVIQMLAERASSNPELKALMKIVAQGNASQEELAKFQSHINDLTRLQKAREAARHPTSTMQSPAPSGPSTPHGNHISRPGPAPPVRAMPTPPPPRPVPQPQALRSKGPVPPAKGDVTGVVFEFVGGNGDRYLFPKFSIIEPRGQDPYVRENLIIVSFLIARKGSSSDSPTYDPNLDYYQPITIRLYAQEKFIHALQKVIAPPDEVRRYMEDVMENMTRAEYVLLAMRLPREGEPTSSTTQDKEKTEVVQPERVGEKEEQVLWATTNGAPPVTKAISKTKAAAVGSQQDKYQCFINTIASTS